MALTPEGRVKRDIKALLISRGIWFFMPQNIGLGVSGVLDFICCIPLTSAGETGKLLAIEAKAFGKRNNTTTLQDKQIESIRTANGWAIVVDDVAQLEEFLKENCGGRKDRSDGGTV